MFRWLLCQEVSSHLVKMAVGELPSVHFGKRAWYNRYASLFHLAAAVSCAWQNEDMPQLSHVVIEALELICKGCLSVRLAVN